VGVLALMSLVMVSMMVKKGTPMPIVTASAAVPEVEEAVTIGSDETVAGEVGESDQALDGMELDSGTVKAQQMIEQVSTMVKENPDGAANLVKRWLNRS
jgi:flagellar biosynthesis/type III secretory pathway M-ring protein FliF/YscJ